MYCTCVVQVYSICLQYLITFYLLIFLNLNKAYNSIFYLIYHNQKFIYICRQLHEKQIQNLMVNQGLI